MTSCSIPIVDVCLLDLAVPHLKKCAGDGIRQFTLQQLLTHDGEIPQQPMVACSDLYAFLDGSSIGA